MAMFDKLKRKIKKRKLADEYAEKITSVICNSDRLNPIFATILIDNLCNDFELKSEELKEKI